MKTLSTTALAKELGISRDELFEFLNESKFIFRKDKKWHLTSKGIDAGGKIISSEDKGEFIVWPEDFDPHNYTIDLST